MLELYRELEKAQANATESDDSSDDDKKSILLNYLTDTTLFYFSFTYSCLGKMIRLLELFESENIRIHLIYRSTMGVIRELLDIILKENVQMTETTDDQYLNKLSILQSLLVMQKTDWFNSDDVMLENLYEITNFRLDELMAESELKEHVASCRVYIYALAYWLYEKVLAQHDNKKTFQNLGLLDPSMRKANLSFTALLDTFKYCFKGATHMFESLQIKQQFDNYKTFEFEKVMLDLPIEQFWYKLSTDDWIRKDNQKTSFKKLADFMMKLIILPSSASQAERDFSSMGDIKTKKRNKLKPRLINAILQV